jgi:phage gpG-like protein
MSITVKGIPQLQRRLKAVGKTAGRSALAEIRVQATANAKRNVHRRTGNLGRSIRPGALTDSYTIVQASANYAAYEEFGTRAHVIRPRRASRLAFPAAGSARLSGSVRRGGSLIFATKVNHPGTKPHPFLVPGAKKAVSDVIGAEVVVRAWNAAA